VDTSAKFHLQGAVATKEILRLLPHAAQKKSLRKAVNAGATPIVRAVRANAPQQSGTLRKAIGKKVKVYGDRGIATAVIGAKKGYSGDWKGKKRMPSRYFHLVNKGHGGPAPAPAHEFVESSFASSQSAALDAMESKLAESVEQEAAKLARV